MRLLRLLAVSALWAPLLALSSAAQGAPARRSTPLALAVPDEAPGRLIVVYRDAVPENAEALVAHAGGLRWRYLPHLGLSVVQVAPGADESTRKALADDPAVRYVLQDHRTQGYTPLLRRLPATGHAAIPSRPGTSLPSALRPIGHPALPPRRPVIPFAPAAPSSPAPPASTPPTSTPPSPTPSPSVPPPPTSAPVGPPASTPTSAQSPPEAFYNTPQGWAVLRAGGYGEGVEGGPAAGPWNASLGAGVRIAILDSGVDPNHPDIAPNLVYNLSEVNVAALPSPCDDGSPVDQQGHGTWSASLAAAAIGGGEMVGVAPQASILNIKVLERLPAATGGTTAAQCEAGEAGGLLSWTLQGIEDALAAKANVISISLGTLVDLSTGDGAGWKASFDQVTYAAQQAGAVIVAAAGNDGLDLSTGTLMELPAQSRGVLAVTALTNPSCAENLNPNAACFTGPVTRPYYSNHGGNLNAIAAPGGSYPEGSTSTGVSGWIRGACSSGLPGTTDGLPGNPGESLGCFNLGHTAYVQAMGTSASAPLVAGAAAILHAARPDWTAAQIVAALRSSATQNPGTDPELNLAAALQEP